MKKLKDKNMKKRYVVTALFSGYSAYAILDTILDKIVSSNFQTREHAEGVLEFKISIGELKQISYKEDKKKWVKN